MGQKDEYEKTRWLYQEAQGKITELRRRHTKMYRTTADEVWEVNPVCSECQVGWPCSTIEIVREADGER